MYCTLDDLKKLVPEDVLVQLTDDENLGEVDTARVNEAITQADAEIDGYLGGRYAVPLTSVPDMVKKLSIDIALYNLYSRTVSEMPSLRGDRYCSAVRQLEGIAKGIITLGVSEMPSAPTDSGAETNKNDDGNVFSRDSMKGF